MGDEKSRGTRTTGQTKNTMPKQGGCCTYWRSLFILTVVFPTSGRVKRTNRHHRHFDTNLRHSFELRLQYEYSSTKVMFHVLSLVLFLATSS